MSIITEWFSETHNENYPNAKYKIKQEVIYNPLETNFPQFRGREFIITGVNWMDTDNNGKDIFEYSLLGFPYLVYEDEIELAPQKFCLQCGAPKEFYKCSYCGV